MTMQSKTAYREITKYATVFLILYCIYYIPIDTRETLGPVKLTLLGLNVFVLLFYTFKISKALIIGCIYLIYQFISASFHPETWRWSTLLYSVGLVSTYICFYNLVVIEKVFTINHFIRICKWVMGAYFVVCIIQQFFLLIGINYFPLINLCQVFNRGIGCNSLCQEPSTFGRFMLVFYYAYLKCCEYKRGEGPFTLNELFCGEHKWVTIRFLWMMLTMGSGTAFVCLILFSLYFVRRHNWYYVIPILAICYTLIQESGIEALDRATNSIEATSSLDAQTVRETDNSASARITPMLNAFKADFTQFDTWFGKGIDAGHSMKDNKTLFDDYGFVFYIIKLLFNFICAYNVLSLSTIFMLCGIGGGSGGNIQYAWALMMVMTCVKYFHENRYNPEIYEEEYDDEEEELCEEKVIEESKKYSSE